MMNAGSFFFNDCGEVGERNPFQQLNRASDLVCATALFIAWATQVFRFHTS